MRKMTPRFRMAVKLLPASLLLAMAMPAHSVYIDQPGVKNGLRFYFGTSISPSLSTTSRTFHYTYANPAIYGPTGNITQVLADQDKKLTDEELRLSGFSGAYAELYASQAINKNWRLGGSVLVDGGAGGIGNYGAYWGMSADYSNTGTTVARFTLGGRNNGLAVSKTGLGMVNTLNDSGLNLVARYWGVPDLTITGYHMFRQTADVRDDTDGGWHKSNGLSVQYSFLPTAHQQLTLALGGTYSRGHKTPFYWNSTAKANAYMAGMSYRYNKATLSVDYGVRTDQYNKALIDKIDTKTYGAKLDYKITPRLTANVSYGHKESENTKPISFDNWVAWGLRSPSQNDNIESRLFNQVKQDRYSAGLSYQVWSNVSLNGSVAKLQTKNYFTEGEFSKREELTTTVGASFSF